MLKDDRNLDTIPVGELGIVAMDNCKELGIKVDKYIAEQMDKLMESYSNEQ